MYTTHHWMHLFKELGYLTCFHLQIFFYNLLEGISKGGALKGASSTNVFLVPCFSVGYIHTFRAACEATQHHPKSLLAEPDWF